MTYVVTVLFKDKSHAYAGSTSQVYNIPTTVQVIDFMDKLLADFGDDYQIYFSYYEVK